jgi:hypothetical protein
MATNDTGIESLIGKTIASIDDGEHRLRIDFADGSRLTIEGAWRDGSALLVDVATPEETAAESERRARAARFATFLDSLVRA